MAEEENRAHRAEREQLEKNKNQKKDEKVKNGTKTPYAFIMDQKHEDRRKKKMKFFTKSKLFTLLFVFIIVVVNLVVIFPLFKPGAAQVNDAISKNVSQINLLSQDPVRNWDNTWYLGFPIYFMANALIPYLFAFIKGTFEGINVIYLLKVLLGLLYLGVPVGIYFLTRYLSKKEFVAIMAALIYSLPSYLFAWIPEVSQMFKEYGPIPWQVYLAKFDGSAVNHLLALFILPFASIFFLRTLRNYNFKNLLITSALFALIGFSHSLSLVTVIIICLLLIASEAILGHPGEKIRKGVIVLLVTAGLLAAEFNFPYIRNSYFSGEMGEILKNLASLIPLAFVIIPILATILFLIFDRKPRLQVLFIGIVWVIFFLFIILAWSLWGKAVLPAPFIFYMELRIGLSILFAFLISLLVMGFKRYVLVKLNPGRSDIAVIGLIVILISVAVGLIIWPFKTTNSLLSPISTEKKQESEDYIVGQWLEERVGANERVYVTGDLSNWLNAYTLVSQVKGGADVAVVNDLWKKASKEIEEGREMEKTENYLRILGVKYIVVKSPEEEETDREKWEYYYPDKFKKSKLLTLEKNFGPYLIYKVNLKNPSLVAPVDELAYQDLQKESIEQNLKGLAEILDSQSYNINIDQERNNAFHMELDLKNDQGIVIKENYFNTWQAKIGQEKVAIEKDNLGYIYLKPKKEGRVKILFNVNREIGHYIGYLISITTVILLFVFRTKKVKKYVNNYQALPAPKGVLERKPAREKSFVNMMIDHEDELRKKAEEAKIHYQQTKDIDWVEGSDNFSSLSAYFHRNREALTKKLINKFGQGEKYLDAGCGTGLLLRHLPKGSIGLDINSQNISQAKKNVPEAALVVADIENIPFPSNMFDTVVCAEVLDRLPHPKKAIKEIMRVLKPSGILIGTVPRENPLWRLRFLSSAYSPEPYRFEYSRKNLEELLGPFEKIVVSPALSYMTWAFVVKKKGGII